MTLLGRLRASLARLLFSLARNRIGAVIIRRSFAALSAWMPLHRLHETELVVAFYHPKPSYKIHILIVPKRAIANVLALSEADLPVLQDVITTTQHLVRELKLAETGYRLLVNGGAYQDVAQLHFHLISEADGAGVDPVRAIIEP
jgi:histidine triad (HIT) family protein